MKIPRSGSSLTFAGILLFGLLAMTARNTVDPDLWWHLRTGQWILEMRAVPHVDPFSFTRAGSPWVSHEWLSEVLFYGIWKYLGSAGLMMFSALVTTAGFMILYFRCPGKGPWAAAVLTLAALTAAPAWGARPQMFTFAFASLLLWLLESGEARPWLVFWIPPLFLLWLNLHAGFAFGLALMVTFGAGMVWEAATGATSWAEVRPHLLRLGSAVCVCLAIVPLNPSGAHLYRYPLDVVRSAEMRSFINEWFPPDFHHIRYLPLFLLWAALLWAMAFTSRQPKARILAPLVFTLFAALDAVRHIPLLVLVAAPIVAAALSGVSLLSRFQPRASASESRIAFRVAVLTLLAAFAVTRWTMLARAQAGAERDEFPTRAIAFLRDHPLPSHLFAYYDWGGYAVWTLYPEYRVFVDGRADLYGDPLLRQFRQAAELRSGWKKVLDEADVPTVLVPPAGALAQGLLLDTRWQTEYRDSQAILFVRAATARPTRAKSGIWLSRAESEKMCSRPSGICETTAD